MAQVSERTTFNDTALVRLLSQLGSGAVRRTPQATAELLGQWFSWTDAISLSAALNANPVPTRADAAVAETEYARVRAALLQAVGPNNAVPLQHPAEFPPYRRHHLARQQAMEAAIEPLRARLRAAVASRSSEFARLAALDAVMEQMLAERSRALLASVPGLLEQHFVRLRDAAAETEAPTDDADAEAVPTTAAITTPPPAHDWLAQFREDSQALLMAELDFRFQPLEGLLATLRMRPPGSQ